MNWELLLTGAGLVGIPALLALWRLSSDISNLKAQSAQVQAAKADGKEVARLEERVRTLEESAKQHSDTRDIVIAMRSDLQSLEKAMTGFADSVREAVRELTSEVREVRTATRRARVRAVS